MRRKYPPHCRPGVALLFLRAFLLAILHAHNQRRNACIVHPGRIATNAHTIRQRLQPTSETETLANVHTVSESIRKREPHTFPHTTPVKCGHAEQRAASFRRRSTQPTQREQTTNVASGSTAKRQPPP